MPTSNAESICYSKGTLTFKSMTKLAKDEVHILHTKTKFS